LPQPLACACRFSQPLGAFIRPEPGGLVACRIRSWGCTLQSFAPPVQPYAVSGAPTLMTFHRLQGLAPHVSPLPPSDPRVGDFLRCSPGLAALQGSLPRWLGTAFTAPPLTRLAPPRTANGQSPQATEECRHHRVCTPTGLARLRRDRRPSWALPPSDLQRRWVRTRFGSRLLWLRGASPSPGRAFFEPSNLSGRSRR
jgi:hypothetical protein